MEKFEISVAYNGTNQHFEVRDYMHHEGDKCKYEIYQQEQFIGSFEPDGHNILHICKDPGVVPQNILHLVAAELEKYHI